MTDMQAAMLILAHSTKVLNRDNVMKSVFQTAPNLMAQPLQVCKRGATAGCL